MVMIKTDVPNYFKRVPGVVIHKNDQEKTEILKHNLHIQEKLAMQEQINNMSKELEEIKDILKLVVNNKE